MTKVRVHSFSVSVDGYGAGAHQDLTNPMGVGAMALHEWALATRGFREMSGHAAGGGGAEAGTTGVDNGFFARGFENIGAWILGRNMFGPVRGPWPDESWKGWWGDTPPYHVPVFVLTHYTRPSFAMKGGTTFHFVTDGIASALRQAIAAAGAKDVRIGGGVATVQQYLRAGSIDEMHLAVAPVLLGAGEHLYAGLDLPALGYRVREQIAGEKAVHVVVAKR